MKDKFGLEPFRYLYKYPSQWGGYVWREETSWNGGSPVNGETLSLYSAEQVEQLLKAQIEKDAKICEDITYPSVLNGVYAYQLAQGNCARAIRNQEQE